MFGCKAKFGGFVSPLKGVDSKRDEERDGCKVIGQPKPESHYRRRPRGTEPSAQTLFAKATLAALWLR